MKKTFALALLAAATLSFTGCSSDEENLAANKGFINLGITTDNTIVTRAVQTADASQWYALVSNGQDYVYGTTDSYRLIGTELATTGLAAGSAYSVAVSNYATANGWQTANDNYGDAYYTGSTETEQTVTAGQTTNVNIACGTAKNAKFQIVSSGFAGSALAVTVTNDKDNRSLSFDKSATPSTIGKVAYFEAGAKLTLAINYTINNNTKTLNKELTLGGAATANTLTISSDQNGYISVSITYDDAFGNGTGQTIEIDSSTGDEQE